MSREDLQAGRELDRLVAEKIMGWKWVLCQRQGDPASYRCLESPEHIAEFHLPLADLEVAVAPVVPHALSLPRYSTNIAAAWEVVEFLALKNIVVCLLDRIGFAEDTLEPLWRCGFMDSEAHEAESSVEETWFSIAGAETAPLAICLAALEVVK